MKLNKFIFLIILSIIFFEKTKSQDNISIIFKINDKIITNRDIQNEELYLSALNEQFQNLTKEKKYEIAKGSILKEEIKKNEILKYYVLDQKDPLLEKVIQNFVIRLKLKDRDGFKAHLSNYNVGIETVIKKIEIETIWNSLIYKKYQGLVKIDKQKLIKKIKKQTEKKKSYLLSEIIFKKNNNEKLDETSKKIYNSINEIGFQNTANIYSISDSSKLGGDIGWIEETELSKDILKVISKLNIGEHSPPILRGSGYLILKIDEIKFKKKMTNKDEELKKRIQFDTSRQLEQFSKIYYNKVKINSVINEL